MIVGGRGPWIRLPTPSLVIESVIAGEGRGQDEEPDNLDKI